MHLWLFVTYSTLKVTVYYVSWTILDSLLVLYAYKRLINDTIMIKIVSISRSIQAVIVEDNKKIAIYFKLQAGWVDFKANKC